MVEVASAFVSLLPSAKGFGSKLEQQVGRDLDGTGKRLGSRMGTALKVGAVAAAAGAFMFAKDAVAEAREAQKVGALTESIIKSTGGAAKVTAAQVGDLATAISNKTGMDDEAIQSGANMLLTFKQVRNEAGKNNAVFDRATQAAADLSAAGFGDLTGQSKMLGKALNDPVKGMSAMARSGVTFTAAQQEQVKALVETGDTLSAQKIILREVESQVGGAAAASSTAGEKAAVAWGNLKEQVGTAMLPAIDAAAGAFTTTLAPALSKFVDGVGPAFDKVGGALGKVRTGIAPVVGQVRKVWDAFSGGGATFDAVVASVGRIKDTIADAFGGGGGGNPLQSLADGFKSVLPTIVGAAGTAGKVLRDTILPAVEQLVGVVVANLVPVLQVAANTFKTVVLPAVLGVGQYLIANLWPILKQVWSIVATQVIPIVAQLATFFYGTLYPAIVRIVVAIGQQLKPVFDAIFHVITATVLPAVTKLLTKFKQWLPTITMVIGVIVKVVGAVLTLAAAILGKVLPPVIKFAGWLIGALVGALSTVIGWVIKIIGWVVSFGVTVFEAGAKVGEFVGSLRDKFGEAVAFVKGIPGKIADAVGNLGSLLYDKGKELIQGLIDGIANMLGSLKDKMGDVAGTIGKFLPGSPVKEGPLRSWNRGGAGKRLVGLLAEGLDDPRPVDRAMNNLTRRINVPRVTPDLALVGNGSGRRGGTRMQLVLADGRALDAYVREVADGSVADARAFAGTRRRMG